MSTRKRKPAQESLTRPELEARHGRVWDTREFAREFVVLAIIDDRVVVRRKADATVGKMTFSNSPRYYFGFEPTEPDEGQESPNRFRAGGPTYR